MESNQLSLKGGEWWPRVVLTSLTSALFYQPVDRLLLIRNVVVCGGVAHSIWLSVLYWEVSGTFLELLRLCQD